MRRSIMKLHKPLVVAAMNGPVVVVTLPADANVEFDPIADDDLSDDDLTGVLCDGESYLARSQELLEAVQPVGLAKP
jgi:hypothetical protein